MQAIIEAINQAILGEYESNSIEFKKCSTDCPALYETLSSFSNQDCGGCIVLEIDEKQGFKPVIIQDIQKCVSQVQHRDYSQYTRGEAISLNIFADRLEITSPGGIFGGYSLKSIEAQEVRSLRNPILVNLVEMSNLTENRGTGLAVAERAMIARSLSIPKYEIVNNHFKATLYNDDQTAGANYTSVFAR